MIPRIQNRDGSSTAPVWKVGSLLGCLLISCWGSVAALQTPRPFRHPSFFGMYGMTLSAIPAATRRPRTRSSNPCRFVLGGAVRGMPPEWRCSELGRSPSSWGGESNMTLPKISSRTLPFSAVLFCFVSLLIAEAQDVDVPGNLTMHDSADPTVGNILKEGVPFIHNFGTDNTFLGSGAGNFTMSGFNNTATGNSAFYFNTSGNDNTATGFAALGSNGAGNRNTAT